MGLWAMRASHSTATLSSGGTRGLYGLRFMHRLNIFLSRFGPRAGRAPFLSRCGSNPNPIARLESVVDNKLQDNRKLCMIKTISIYTSQIVTTDQLIYLFDHTPSRRQNELLHSNLASVNQLPNHSRTCLQPNIEPPAVFFT